MTDRPDSIAEALDDQHLGVHYAHELMRTALEARLRGADVGAADELVEVHALSSALALSGRPNTINVATYVLALAAAGVPPVTTPGTSPQLGAPED